jgi:hypothetical protein
MFLICALAAVPCSAQKDRYCKLGNLPAFGAAADGPALLPTRCINTSLANTPAPGAKTHVVPAVLSGPSSSLQLAYNAAQCGDQLIVPAGTVFQVAGQQLRFAEKHCDAQHWIWIKSNGTLPPEGSRVTPADVAQMFTIQFKGPGGFIFAGSYLRFMGIELVAAPGASTSDFVVGAGSSNDIFDRDYLHGLDGQESVRGLNLSGWSNVGIVESYLANFKCIAVTGSCSDAHAIGGGLGSGPMGTYEIYDNYLEASGENILFGGGAATTTPCDIDIRHNTLAKPAAWNPASLGFAGPVYIVKNLFELKNACRVLFEGNTAVNNWGGFSQRGFALSLGPKSQAGANGTNLCPACLVSDVTIRYSRISNSCGGFALFNSPSDNGGWAAFGGRYRIHDVVLDGLQSPAYGCGLNLNEINSGYSAASPPPAALVLNNVAIDHITAIAPSFVAKTGQESAFVELDGPPAGNATGTPQASNIAVTNSIVAAGGSGTYPTGGGAANCAVLGGGHTHPGDEWSRCFTGTSPWGSNVIVSYPGPVTNWPAGNFFAAGWADVSFVNFNGGLGGDYHLAAASPFKGKAGGGTDPGADIDLVDQYTQ